VVIVQLVDQSACAALSATKILTDVLKEIEKKTRASAPAAATV